MKKILKITTVSILSLIILLLLLMTLGIVITNKPQMQLGLNGVHQLTETNNNTYAAVGSWTSPNTFSIDCEIIGYSTKDKWNFTFDEDEILIEEVGVTGKYNYGGKRINNRIIKE